MANYLMPKRGRKITAENRGLILKNGEVFFEVPDTGTGTGAGKIKMGDGVHSYADLPYFLSETDIDNSVIKFVDSITPTEESYNDVYLSNIKPSNSLRNIFTSLKQLLVNFNYKLKNLTKYKAGTGLEEVEIEDGIRFNVKYGNTAGTACAGNDDRLIPVEYVNGSGLKTRQIDNKTIEIAAEYGTTENTVCAGNDSRLSDARTPKSHATTSTTYGGGNASNYGHVKLSNVYDSSVGSASDSLGASQNAVYNLYNAIKTKSLNISRPSGITFTRTYFGLNTLERTITVYMNILFTEQIPADPTGDNIIIGIVDDSEFQSVIFSYENTVLYAFDKANNVCERVFFKSSYNESSLIIYLNHTRLISANTWFYINTILPY